MKSSDIQRLVRGILLAGVGLGAVACANASNDDGDTGGAGGSASTTTVTTTSVSTTASTTTATGSTSTGGACSQDCSTVEVPLCFESVCNPTTHTCEVKPAAEGTACEDGLYCTVDDACHDGTCQAGTARVCDDNGTDPCLTSTCDDDLDACTSAPAANGTSCTPTTGDLCNSANAICQNGNCLGAPKDCSSVPLPDDCHVAACDSTTGDCILADVSDGTPCASNDFCLGDATCTAGVCQSQPINEGVGCLGGDFCETNKVCTVGVCQGTPVANCGICSETEANNTTATANDDASCTAWGGVIAVVGDKDFYAVHVATAGSRINAEVIDVGGVTNTCPTGFDSVLRLYDSTGTQIATDDDGGMNNCSFISGLTSGSTNLPAGDYYVSVEEFSNDGTSPPYLLSLAVLAPGCGNGIVEGTEACDGTSLGGEDCVSQGFGSGTLGCDASCQFDTAGCSAPFCGDGLVQAPGESCDGTALNGQTCASQGFASGTLSCTAGCAFDTSACNAPGCGDGILSVGEECDDANGSSTDGCDSTCLVVPACAAGQTRVSVASNTSTPIPDLSTITSTLNVAQIGNVQSLWVVLDITHTFDADLDISLIPPAVPETILVDDNGIGVDNYTSTIFGSTATAAISSGTAPFTGLFMPQGSFAPIIGSAANGTWTLKVTDDAGSDVGTLNHWRIVACVQ